MPDDNQPPPQEWTWDTTLRDFLLEIYHLSPQLTDNAPRCIRLYADRVQVNWQESGLEDGSEMTVIELAFTARPVKPAEITFNVTS